MNLDKVTNEDEYLRALISDAVWTVLYHEESLAKAHVTLAIVKTMLARVGVNAAEQADITDDEPEAEDAEDATEYARALLGRELSSVKHHEYELRNGHKKMAFTKAVLARANYEVDMKQIEAEQAARLKGNE